MDGMEQTNSKLVMSVIFDDRTKQYHNDAHIRLYPCVIEHEDGVEDEIKPVSDSDIENPFYGLRDSILSLYTFRSTIRENDCLTDVRFAYEHVTIKSEKYAKAIAKNLHRITAAYDRIVHDEGNTNDYIETIIRYCRAMKITEFYASPLNSSGKVSVYTPLTMAQLRLRLTAWLTEVQSNLTS